MKRETVHLGYLPRHWQESEHLRVAEKLYYVLAVHRRGGKTEFVLMHMISKALKNKRPKRDGFYVYFAPLLKQAKLIAWERLKRYALQIPMTEVNEGELWVRFKHNGATIRVMGADNPDAVRGIGADGAVLDESKDMKPEIWTEIVQPMLADRGGWCVFIGTPKGVNLFSELMNQARADKSGEWGWNILTVHDTDVFDAVSLARMQRNMPDGAWRREMLCDFSAAADDQLLSLADVEAACLRHLTPDMYEWAPRIIGVDPARFGDDASAIAKRQGLFVHPIKRLYKIDNMALAAAVAHEANEWHADAICVDAGNGSGVIDRLRSLGFEVFEVPFGGSASDPATFYNLRTELYWKTADAVRAGLALPDDALLKGDLAAPTYTINEKDQRRLESKDDIKARLLRSPDGADAVVCTYYADVAPAKLGNNLDPHPTNDGVVHSNWDYDPFSRR